MPFTNTQTFKYTDSVDEIATLAKVIDLLGHKDVPAALELLMRWRNHLQDKQKPQVVDYDPRNEQHV